MALGCQSVPEPMIESLQDSMWFILFPFSLNLVSRVLYIFRVRNVRIECECQAAIVTVLGCLDLVYFIKTHNFHINI